MVYLIQREWLAKMGIDLRYKCAKYQNARRKSFDLLSIRSDLELGQRSREATEKKRCTFV